MRPDDEDAARPKHAFEGLLILHGASVVRDA